jgi:diamine N-acetyltransferase
MIKIDRADPADATALSPLATQSFIDAWAPIIGLVNARRYTDAQLTAAALAADIRAHADTFWVARVDQALAGYAKLIPNAPRPPRVAAARPDAVLMQRLYVTARWRGHGVSDALYATALEAAFARGAGVWLVTDPRNARAWAYYVKRGFIDTDPYRYEYAPGEFNEQVRALLKVR